MRLDCINIRSKYYQKKTKNLTRDIQRHFIMLKGSLRQEDFMPDKKVSKYVKQTLIELKDRLKIHNRCIFEHPLSCCQNWMNISRHKIMKIMCNFFTEHKVAKQSEYVQKWICGFEYSEICPYDMPCSYVNTPFFLQ